MKSYTHRTGWEACGLIASNNHGRYGVVLGSNHSQIGCLAGEAGLPNNMIWTGKTLHSHPEDNILKMEPNDRKYAKATHTADPYANFFDGSPNGFSHADFSGGPGYLVTKNSLLYQNGRPTRYPKVIGSVE